MSINNFFQDEIFDTENFEGSYYFPPIFTASDEIDSIDDIDLNNDINSIDSNDVFDTYRSESLLENNFGFEDNQRVDASGSLMGLGVNPATSQGQANVSDAGYIQAYLRSQIGRFVRVEFLIGTNVLTDRSGVLSEVGINYIVLTEPSGAKIMCDLYSIKFVTTATTNPLTTNPLA